MLVTFNAFQDSVQQDLQIDICSFYRSHTTSFLLYVSSRYRRQDFGLQDSGTGL